MSFSIGLVGAGQFAPSFLRLWLAHPDVTDVRLTDVLPDRMAEMAARFGISTTYQSFEEMLNSDVDAVAIFTQRWLHGEMAIQALEAGKHVYSTVPMAIEADQIARIIELVRETGLTYMMGETSFYYPSSVYCRERLAKGDFGRVFYSEGDYVHDMDLGFYSAYQYSGGEKWKEVASFPPMLYPTHAVGNVLSVTGQYATHVSCIGVKDDRGDGVFDKEVSQFDNDFSNATALFKLADGGVMRTNEMRRVGYPSHIRESRLRIFGTEGSFEQLAETSVWQTKQGVEDITDLLKTSPSGSLDDEDIRHVDPALRDAFRSGLAPVHDRSRLPTEFTGLHNGHDGSHHYLADDFARAVTDRTIPPVNAWVAARYTLPGIVAHQSALQGGVQLEIPDHGDAPAA
ncbi:Gfo/Idh/MocA family protein [Kribbella deserti]|uniref:Gfo/Idh/MocA family protein n=1 Tax=Kribbella deserti TaxID=1926257 RepID=A0ABV6QR73_9ACTN